MHTKTASNRLLHRNPIRLDRFKCRRLIWLKLQEIRSHCVSLSDSIGFSVIGRFQGELVQQCGIYSSVLESLALCARTLNTSFVQLSTVFVCGRSRRSCVHYPLLFSRLLLVNPVFYCHPAKVPARKSYRNFAHANQWISSIFSNVTVSALSLSSSFGAMRIILWMYLDTLLLEWLMYHWYRSVYQSMCLCVLICVCRVGSWFEHFGCLLNQMDL